MMVRGLSPLFAMLQSMMIKAATHKLALLRVLLRIADGHPGAVLRRESSALGGKNGDRVILPAGLVALYWLSSI